MSDTIIIFNPSNYKNYRKGAVYLGGIKLNPGQNRLSPSAFEKVSSIPDFEKLVSKDALNILKGKPPDDGEKETKSLAGFTVKEAEKLIYLTKDVNLLKLWQSNEAKTKEREGVLNAIARQISSIETGSL